ncbi:hypothetical protein [Pseudomonas sp. Marseille-Q1929]|uniref:hypothetical protein n=1 Tax=Pseudomonas sp. Marseille-Q1929 TaxID=2730402 RepID=UPI0032429DB5
MQIPSPVSTSSPGFFTFPVRDTHVHTPERAHTPAPRRVPRDTSGQDPNAPSYGIPDSDVPELFQAKVITAKHELTRSEFMRGYNAPTSVTLPGYSASMSDVALMRIVLDHKLSPEQTGALLRIAEQRVINGAQNNVRTFTKVVSGSGIKITPAPQSYYLSMVNQLAGGECAGLSHLLSLAVAEGKQHTFLGNLYYAVANPDTPESQAFFMKIAEVQARVKNRGIAHDPATVKFAPYTDIAPQLLNSPTTKTILISSEGHRLTAGVIVDPEGGRTYYFSDPNHSFTEVVTEQSFKGVLDKVFTDPRLKGFIQPLKDFPGEQKYLISVFNRDYIPEISGASNDIKFMYERPLGGLDDIRVLKGAGLPTVDDSRLKTYTPEKTAEGDYDYVLQKLDNMQASRGLAQYHEVKAAREAVKIFIAKHPTSSVMPAMQTLEQRLEKVINEAAAPVEYPFVFERMERDRVLLAEDKVGKPKHFQSDVIDGKTVDIKTRGGGDPGRIASVGDALKEALTKLSQSDPAAAQAVGNKLRVIIANPGDQPETRLLFDSPPMLVIGDDFFASPSAHDTTVADRIGGRAQAAGGDAQAQKQGALIAGKLGMLGYYKADSGGFLEVVNNKETFRDGGDKISPRATRSPGDFLEESFTARLYDGTLDSDTDASLRRLFSPASTASPSTPAAPPSQPLPPTPPQAPSKPLPSAPSSPPPTVTAIDEAEIDRLQALDDSHPPIRIGELEVSRVELYKMGVHAKGKPIESALTIDADKHISADVEIDYNRFLAYLKGTSPDIGARATSIVSEIAATRKPGDTPLATRGDGGLVPEQFQQQLDETSRQAAAIREMARGGKPPPANLFSSPSADGSGSKTQAAGLGFQAFGTYQGLRASIEAFQRGDTTAGAIGLGSVASDYVGMGVEAGANKLAKHTISKVASPILGFKASAIGKMLGKAAGGAGAVFSVPFDVYNAVDSFNKAANSTGKEAQDHYVSGAFSVASAATSIALSAAFMAGVSSAGPAGLIVAAVLMVGQAIYSAVRLVEDIDELTPLTGGQKFTVGLGSLLGLQTPFNVMKPYLEAKYRKAYERDKEKQHKVFLEGPGKASFERVVYGSLDVDVKSKSTRVPYPAYFIFSPGVGVAEVITGGMPGYEPIVNQGGGNDYVIARDSETWAGKRYTVEGELGPNKATLWDMGDGDDVVKGVQLKPNYFLLGGGKKLISGGDADDTFIFNADARQTLQQVAEVGAVWNDKTNGFGKRSTELWGEGGSNTLMFNGELTTSHTERNTTRSYSYAGHLINFRTGTIAVTYEDSQTRGATPIARFHSFSNAVTVENGKSYIVGDEQNNVFTLNGEKDVVLTGKGDNVVVINGGATVVGEGGSNTYLINKGNKDVTIKDPNDSAVRLDYSATQVSSWSVSPSGDLTVNLKGDKPGEERKLIIQNAFTGAAEDGRARPIFVTNDGVMMTVTAPRQADSTVRVPQVTSTKVETDKPTA